MVAQMKKIFIILGIAKASFALLKFIFPKELKVYYSLDTLKELLEDSKTMIICRYDVHNPYNFCSEDTMIKSISDEDEVNEIISLITTSNISNGKTNMMGAGTVIHTFDANGNFLVNIFYYPYVGLEKGDSFYTLDSKNAKRIIKILE